MYRHDYSQSVAGEYTSIVTVVDAAENYDLATTAQVKVALGITSTTEDAKIAQMISGVSASFLNFIGRVLAEETVAEKFRIRGTVEKLQLSRYPVSDISSVTADGTLLDDGDYEVDPKSGLLTRLNSDCETVWCERTVVVAYTGGYAEPEADLVQEVATNVNHARSLGGRDPYAKSIMVQDVETVEYWVGDTTSSPSGFSASTEAALKRYRMIRG